MSDIAATLADVRNGPAGPEIGAFFDFDGTIIEGYSVMAFYEHRFRNFEIGPEEATRTMWARSRTVVVLPFVPVTATTGLDGSGTVGGGPGSTSRRRPAPSPSTRGPWRLVEKTESSARATSVPRAWAALLRRQGNATTI